MKQGKKLRWGRLAAFLLGGLGVNFVAGGAVAQEARPIPRSFVNKSSANLPINLDERARPQLQEVQLFVKENPQAPWTLKHKVSPLQPFFNFKAPDDGEYAFCVVTVDRQGRSVPADVTKEKPGLIVMFDTKAPNIDLQILGDTSEGQEVRCEVLDANPDPTKTRFFFQTRDQVWRPLDPVAGKENLFCIPAQAATTGMIKVTATDLAGNTTTKELNVGKAPNNVAVVPGHGQQGVMTVDAKGEKVLLSPPPEVDKGARTTDRQFAERIEMVVNKSSGPALLPTEGSNQSDKNVVPVQNLAKPPLLGKRHLVNSNRVYLEYQIEQTGASGVGRVEIWLTRDMGKSWQKLGEDAKRKSPAEVDLPGDGLFGISMLVSNGRGFSAKSPSAGDAPDMWIEVDTTRPVAELTGARATEDGAFQITWKASDKNISDEPIDIYFASNREGPWRPIAKGLKNDGSYRWAPTQEAGAQAFLRLVAHDLAGNVAVSETLEPITLDDMSRPRGRLTGISTTPR